MKYPLLAIILMLLTACSNNPGSDSANQAETIARAQARAWFCQMNELGTDWDCVQDAELARNPKPDRLPGRKPDAEVSPATQGEDTSSTKEQNMEAAAPAAAPSATTAPLPADLPTHIALSYRPAEPVAIRGPGRRRRVRRGRDDARGP